MSFQYDLLVIGAGSGGVAASRRAASYGARVAIAEERRVGGTCVLRGCVPKKLLVYGSHFADDLADAAGFGWQISGAALDWAALVAAKDRELDRLNGVYERLLKESGVEVLRGRARVLDPHTVAVGEAVYSAANILVATGSRPVLPPEIRGVEHAITSDEALSLPALPRRAAIIGGGYIAVEFAGILHAAGSQVELLVRGDTVLRGFDHDVAVHLGNELQRRGVKLREDTRVHAIDSDADGTLTLDLEHGETVTADVVLCATGRAPNTAGLGLAEVGVALNEIGAVVVDEFSRSAVPSLFAVGDCTDRLNLTPVAIAEGRAVAETLFHDRPTAVPHQGVPTAVFSQPPVGTVGLSEAAARLRFPAVDVYVTSFRPMKHNLSGREERTMMKLVVDGESGRVLGCHMVGEGAPEIIQGLAVAMQCGATKAHFDATIGIHPTSAEEFVLMREKRPPHPPR